MDHEKTLLFKYLDGEAGLDEKRQLLEILRNKPEARQELQAVYSQWAEEKGRTFDPYMSLDSVLEKVSRRRPSFIPVLAVAVVAIAAVLIVYPFSRHHIRTVPSVQAELYAWTDSDESVVLLPDGRKISSHAREMQVSCLPGGFRIDGADYDSDLSPKSQCMVAVPYGRRARVQFADGSVVLMNSHSRIVFPSGFGRERRVNMLGEAFFDVARDKYRPFVVDIDDVQVKVLGTRFLVSGNNADERRIALISGSVNVSLGDSKSQSVTLSPSQLCTLDGNGKINVADVDDFGSMLDWTEGVYRARNASMKELLSYMSNYYGVHIDYSPAVAGLSCTGTLMLKKNISEMLSDLSRSLPLRSSFEDGIWTVNLSNN